MKKTIIVITSVCIVIVGILTAVFIDKRSKTNVEEIETLELSREKVTDECTEEYEIIKNETIETNSDKVRISPHAAIILKKHYGKCGHITSQYLEVSENLVNMTENQLQQEYNGWEVSKFSNTEIIIEKSEIGECGEHYIVRNKDGKIVIYEILENGEEVEYELTDISIEYLTDTDKLNMEKGVRINGKQELKQYIEDFE